MTAFPCYGSERNNDDCRNSPPNYFQCFITLPIGRIFCLCVACPVSPCKNSKENKYRDDHNEHEKRSRNNEISLCECHNPLWIKNAHIITTDVNSKK